MSEEQRPGETINATISGGVSGQVAVGTHITQVQSIGAPPAAVSEAELAELRSMLAELRAQVTAEAPPDKLNPALDRVGELEAAIMAEKPDQTTMAYVKGWFARNLPKLAGAVASIVVNPIVGKLVEAAGDRLADEIRPDSDPG